MRALVFGSANIDKAYAVSHFVQAGETIASLSYEEHCGGKGVNQAIALARAGANVSFAGAIGHDGKLLEDVLISEDINVDHLMHRDCPTGHAIIQVTPTGQNCIIIAAGANGTICPDDIGRILAQFSPGDWIVLQNEIPHVDRLIACAHARGMVVALNPSPIDDALKSLDLAHVDYLVLNETEGEALAGAGSPDEILRQLYALYPNAEIVLTLGTQGGLHMGRDGNLTCYECLPVEAVDTTGAGDTFTGYFLAERMRGADVAHALEMARCASALSVTRHGATSSIPHKGEVETLMEGD